MLQVKYTTCLITLEIRLLLQHKSRFMSQKLAKPPFTTTLIVTSHERSTCFVLASQVCLRDNWTQRTKTWKKALLSHDATTRDLPLQRSGEIRFSAGVAVSSQCWVHVCWRSTISAYLDHFVKKIVIEISSDPDELSNAILLIFVSFLFLLQPANQPVNLQSRHS